MTNKVVPLVKPANIDHVMWVTEEEWPEYEKQGWVNARNAYFKEEGKWADKRRKIEKEALKRRLEGKENGHLSE